MVVQVVIGPAAIRDLILLGWLRDGERTIARPSGTRSSGSPNRRWVTRDILKRPETGRALKADRVNGLSLLPWAHRYGYVVGIGMGRISAAS